MNDVLILHKLQNKKNQQEQIKKRWYIMFYRIKTTENILKKEPLELGRLC